MFVSCLVFVLYAGDNNDTESAGKFVNIISLILPALACHMLLIGVITSTSES